LKHREHLDDLVAKRTAELTKINKQLKKEIIQRKRAEKGIRKAYSHLKKQSLLLMQTEKMSAIGTLVAGVAHELNNPMMGILHFAQYCIKTSSENEHIHSVLKDIERETRRCIDIVNNLLTFSPNGNEGKEKYKKESCNYPLERVLRLLSFRIKKQGVSVEGNVDEDTPPIWMKAKQIQEVFLNLINNALDSLEKSKKKEIAIDVHQVDENVQVSIADSGCGVARENLQSIFDPFFTTKAVGKGTGLGLSLCQSIIKAHGGEITCESKPGEGTKFKVLFPTERRKESEK
jgi:C4-dicarboxylate-specific signal transduction histidine kinase